MFNLFSKKQPVHLIDLVWVSHAQKLNGSLRLLDEKKDALILAWFERTASDFRQFASSNHLEVSVTLVRDVQGVSLEGKTVLMLEHYPLLSREAEVFSNWNAKEILVLNALDEPLLRHFGSEKLIPMMKAMGLKEDEMLEHSMITNAIRNAQKKLDDKVKNESKANSQEEWFALNFPQ